MRSHSFIDELRCVRTRRVISEALDGEASTAEIRQIAPHLAGCTRCRDFAARVSAIARELRSWPDGDLEPSSRRDSRSSPRHLAVIAEADAPDEKEVLMSSKFIVTLLSVVLAAVLALSVSVASASASSAKPASHLGQGFGGGFSSLTPEQRRAIARKAAELTLESRNDRGVMWFRLGGKGYWMS
jgi:anti-sigma factor RsiW